MKSPIRSKNFFIFLIHIFCCQNLMMCSPGSLAYRRDKINLGTVEKGQLSYDSTDLAIDRFDSKLFLEKHDVGKVFAARKLDINPKALHNTSVFELVSTMRFFPQLSTLSVPYTICSDRTHPTAQERERIFSASKHFFDRVETLDLHYNPIDDDMIDVLSMMKGLKKLTLYKCKINEATFKKIQEKVSVKNINLSYNSLHYPLYKKLFFISEDYFGSNSALQELNLQESNLSSHLLRGIGRLKHLRVLDISSNRLPNRAYVHLLEFKNLESLRMGKNKFNKDGIKKVFMGIRTLRSISFDTFKGCTDMAREREAHNPFESWHCWPMINKEDKIAVFSRIIDKKPWLSFSFLSSQE